MVGRIINALLLPRREERGDLVATIALVSFLALLCTLVLGGSTLALGGATPWLTLRVPTIDWATLAGLLGPILAHSIKGAVEGKASASEPAEPPQ